MGDKIVSEEKPKLNVQQAILSGVIGALPILVSLIIWGVSVEKRLTALETGNIALVKSDTVVELRADLKWIAEAQKTQSDAQDRLYSKQQEILQALNKFSSDIKALAAKIE